MSYWYGKVTSEEKCGEAVVEAVLHFESELELARQELAMKGSLEKLMAAMPGITEYRFNQLQEVNAILEYLNIQRRKAYKEKYHHFLENYNRQLSATQLDVYVGATPEVVKWDNLINHIALIRNKYNGILKALEQKSFSLSNISRLRVAGLDDAQLGGY